MESRLKILVLNYEFPPVGGGGGRACADICKALAARGHAVKVLTSTVPGLESKESVDGYQVLRVFTGRRSRFRASFPAMAAYLVAGYGPARRLIRTWQPDVLHAHFAVPTGVLAHALYTTTGVPYVLTAHLGDVPGGVPQKTDRWFRLVYPFTHGVWADAAAVAAVSEYTRSLAREHYPVPIKVIPNGVELPDGWSPNLDVHDPVQLIFAGRFQPQKNLPFLIEALAQHKDLSWHCTLVGDGPQRGEVEALIMSHGMQSRFTLPGWVTPEDVWSLLGKSDVLVMPSLSEGLPVVGVQALAQGLAMFVNAAGGFVDLVEDGVNGRVCPVEDPDCYVQALSELADPVRLAAMRQSSFEKSRAYDIDVVAHQYETLFESVRHEYA